ncbi:MAG: hypothetical protein EAX86_09660 [Candidatus Heimdallarchaeota archaeon]|nr:hypothetical protein [Candidatus Heimdallarchaeota archaeon]
MKALVLAGGSGKEMYPLSEYSPKTMLKIHGKPILEYVLCGLLETGIEEFVIVIGYLGEKIGEMVEPFRQKGINIQVINQKDQKGIEGAILAARSAFSEKDSFLLAYGDILAPPLFYHHLMNSYVNTAADGAVAVTLVGKSAEFGIASIDERGFIQEILPTVPDNGSEASYIFAGASILPGEFFEYLAEEQAFTATLVRLVKEQRRLCASVWQKEWLDVGYPWDLLAANQDAFSNLEHARIHNTAKISPSAYISGLALIEENVIVDHNAVIVGPCFIGKNSYIGTNTLIRDFTCIEENCVIGYSVEIKNSVIQSDVKIGRLSYIGDSVVGQNVRLGSGVTTMNVLTDVNQKPITKEIKGRSYQKLGSVIGPNSTIGSNAVILPEVIIGADKHIPSGSVVEENII